MKGSDDSSSDDAIRKGQVYLRQEYLIRPTTIHISPSSSYKVPFFLPMEHWTALLQRSSKSIGGRMAVFVTLTSIIPENVNCIQATLNQSYKVILSRALNNISHGCVPGKNHLTLTNALFLHMSIIIRVELKLEVEIERVIAGLPQKSDKVFDFSLLSTSLPDKADDVETVSVKASNKCPITLLELEVPVRGVDCKHLQLFDARSFLILCLQTDVWKCPICGEPTFPEDLLKI